MLLTKPWRCKDLLGSITSRLSKHQYICPAAEGHLPPKPDNQTNGVSQQSLVSALDGDKSRDLHLSLRLSVCEGVKVMYNKYQDKKWSQVQETARNIIQNLDGDLDAELTSLPVTSSPGGSTSVDKAADKWSMAFCEFYRDN